MLRKQKEQIVEELIERLRSTEVLFFTDYRGLSMTQIDGVRSALLEHGARFSVVKNSLAKRAADAAGVEELETFLDGPTAIAYAGEAVMVAVAKALNASAKETNLLRIKGGILQGDMVSADQVREIASLPSPDVLQAQTAGAIAAPLNGIVGLLSAAVSGMVGAVDARTKQLELEEA